MCILTHEGYSAGHPWYYVLGGAISTIKAIRACVLASDYRGYLADRIHEAGNKQEPERTQALNALRAEIIATMRGDISRYRECARELRRHRQECTDKTPSVCADIHTAISLKFNHIYNGFANLRTLDEIPTQLDLFSL